MVVATDSQIRDHIARAWSLGQDSAQVSAIVEDDESTTTTTTSPFGGVDDDAPIVKLVNQMLGDAVRLRASDIHIEVQRDTLRVRYRDRRSAARRDERPAPDRRPR